VLDPMTTFAKLCLIPDGAQVFVSYLAGRPPTDRAIREARRAERMGLAKRHYTGTLVSRRLNQKGEIIFTVLSTTRDDERRGTEDGYRTFNPALGTLLSFEQLN